VRQIDKLTIYQKQKEQKSESGGGKFFVVKALLLFKRTGDEQLIKNKTKNATCVIHNI
jgi:hypothetical protein